MDIGGFADISVVIGSFILGLMTCAYISCKKIHALTTYLDSSNARIEKEKQKALALQDEIENLKKELCVITDELNLIKKNPSHDCQLLVKSLLAGKGLIKIEAVDPANLFIWKND